MRLGTSAGKNASWCSGYQKGRAVLGDVVVEDTNRAWVVDLVGYIRFAEKPLADLRVEGELAVEHLDGPARPIAVGGCVDRRHTTNSEEPFEGPLPAERDPHPRLRLVGGRIQSVGGHPDTPGEAGGEPARVDILRIGGQLGGVVKKKRNL